MGKRSGLLAVLLALAVLGCGLKPPPGTPSSSGPTTTSPTVANTSPTVAKPKPRNIIAWIVSLGPGTPPGPNTSDQVNIYRDLQNQNCRSSALNTFNGTEDELDNPKNAALVLYVGAIAACMAALHGGHDWAVAERALEIAPPDEHCLDGSVRALLRRLVEAHRKDPTARLVASGSAGAAPAPPCPRITALTPDHGPVNTPITITGRHLDQVQSITIVVEGKKLKNGEWDENQKWQCITGYDTVASQSDGSIQIQLPDINKSSCPVQQEMRIWIAIAGSDDQLIDSKEFTYHA